LLSKFGEGLGFEQRVCTSPWEYLFINYDGTISPCNAFLTPFSFGKFSGDWKTYFNSPSFLALRASMGKGFQFEMCEWCNKNRRN
jgi:radical SAM protein with 4Fe4S-binding SPASM domain